MIRPLLFSTRSATSSVIASWLRPRGTRVGGAPPDWWRAITRFTVFGVVPLIAAAPR